jgi:hypothetical protein
MIDYRDYIPQCWGSGSGRIRTFLSDPGPEILTGSGSDPLKVLITN